MARLKDQKRSLWVWIAEDPKYGLQGVYATKKAADAEYGPKLTRWPWPSGEGGEVRRVKVAE